jgi:hypothetical protein
MNNENDIFSIIKGLKESNLFWLSLGNKELFHSDFFYWLAKEYPKEVGTFLWNLVRQGDNSNNVLSVDVENPKREQEHYDLTIPLKNGHTIYIENKIKSLPNKEQLENYYNKHNNENSHFILLSLTNPDRIYRVSENKIIQDINGNWIYLSYENYFEFLMNLKPKSSEHFYLIDDYIKFIKNLTELEKSISIDWENEVFDYYDDNNIIIDSLKGIRMDSFFLKKKYYYISIELYDRISRDEDLKDFVKIFSNKYDELAPMSLAVHSNYLRNAIVDMAFILHNNNNLNPYIALQLDGSQYRCFFRSNDEFFSNKYAVLLLGKSGITFGTTDNIKVININKRKDGKDFNSYNKSNLYLYKNLKSNSIKINEIIESMINDIKSIIKFVDGIFTETKNL